MISSSYPLLTLAVILVAGVLAGIAARRAHMPAVTGQILVGILIGPSVLNLAGIDAIHGLHPITNFALGLIAVAVGNHLNLKRLRNAGRRLFLLVLLESTLTPLLVFLALGLTGASPSFAFLLAAMAISTAPATIVAIVKEGRAKGVFVKTLVAAVALNNMACIAFFELAHRVARSGATGGGEDLWGTALAPLRVLAVSAVLGFAVGGLLVLATRRMVRSDQLATASMVAILLTAGLADFLGFSSLLACLFLGTALANLTPDRDEIGHRVFDNFEAAILAVFFTLAGMELDFSYLVPGGLLALLVVGARLVGKVASGWIAMRLAGAPRRIRRNLGMALVPQAGVAVGLVLLVQEDPALEGIRQLFLAVGLTSVTLNEIIGPVLTRLGLQRSGEMGRDRARLIDFLHEEHILVGLRGATKEEAIARLADHLVSTHHLSLDKESFLEGVLRREREFSTCLGHGLAIPHGILEHGEGIAGVMGISREGLPFDSPDGEPIHCMVLLATPADQRDRHLEVVAALAKAIGFDPNVQHQLYGAKSPAHAYEILHAEDAEDFNYFLDEGPQPA
jgi:Kef-type K+ transport system membrane component KefB/mannitol/fructose-specific phosphotransferase system IIA component (Ntr-type)